jgi:hypothetical protein
MNTYSINGYDASPGATHVKRSTHDVSLDRPGEKSLQKQISQPVHPISKHKINR